MGHSLRGAQVAGMNDFEYLFALFGLLLGFTLVEVLKGLVDSLKRGSPLDGRADKPGRIGWLTPLLGLFVLLDATSAWVNLWEVRSFLRVGFDSAFAILLVASVYYYAASMVFPEDPDQWPDLDVWFWKHRRQVLIAIAFSNLVGSIYALNHVNAPAQVIGGALISLVFLIGAAVPRNRWIVGGSLALWCTAYLLVGILTAVARV